MAAWNRAVSNILPRLGGKLAVSYIVKRFGQEWGTGIFGAKGDSQYQGTSWPLWNYLLGAGVAYFGGGAVSRYFGKASGDAFMESIFDDLIGRLMYTEVIGRFDWAKENFGFDPIPRGYEDDGRGNRYAIFDDTDYRQSMLGLPTGLTGETALGQLETAGVLSCSSMKARARAAAAPPAMGHLQNGDPYFNAGSADPYNALYTFQG